MRTKNQTTILNPELQPNILIIWVGWVGSMTALVLAKMWLKNITVIDWDEIEDHNVASQFYKEDQLGLSKVEALKENVLEYTWVEVTAIHGWRDKDTNKDIWFDIEADIVILAADNMDVRKEAVDFFKDNLDTLIIESRMWGIEYMIQTFYPSVQYFERLATWFPQEEADPIICTEKAICFNTAVISGRIWEIVSNYIMWKPYEFITTNMFTPPTNNDDL